MREERVKCAFVDFERLLTGTKNFIFVYFLEYAWYLPGNKLKLHSLQHISFY